MFSLYPFAKIETNLMTISSFRSIILTIAGFIWILSTSVTVSAMPGNKPASELIALSEQINATSATSLDKTRKIYDWITKNISYDLEYLRNPVEQGENQDIIRRTLETRKGVCAGYSAIFEELCRLCEIPAFTVHGYTKHFGKIDDIPHAWNAAFVGGKWYLFDPTWGAGYVENEVFVKRASFDFFCIPPSVSIESRMPFDPAWQLLEHPVSHSEFIYSSTASTKPESINFNDSIKVYLKSDSLTRFEIEGRRVLAAGLDHPLIKNYYDYLKKNIGVMIHNREVDRVNVIIQQLNDATNDFNNAIKAFNLYLRERNHQFRKPAYTDQQVRSLIDEPDRLLMQCEKKVRELPDNETDISLKIDTLKSGAADLRKSVDAEKRFVEKYCKTPKYQRMTLFRAKRY